MISTFKCSPSNIKTNKVLKNKKGRFFTVDIHCHTHLEKADHIVQSLYNPKTDPIFGFASEKSREVNRQQMATLHSKLTSIQDRLADMDASGIDVQAISPAPHQYYYWAPDEVGRDAARIVNDSIAEIVSMHPDRFVGIGTVPLQNPKMAIAEMERAIKKLGLRGIEIGTNVNGIELSDTRYHKFFATAQELGILIFMHPLGTTEGKRLSEHYLVNIVGNPMDSTIAVSNLIFEGVLEKYPKLKICIAHGGGYLPSYAGRMEHAYHARPDCRQCLTHPPSRSLKKLFFDTIVFDPLHLKFLVDQYGSKHVMMGTDYPYDMSEANPVEFVQSSDLSLLERKDILGINAARLLGIRNRALRF